ncbi:MAG TPA: hypothetical protein VNL39_12645 [Xanthobacteraceae bacterium]|nr:hypothetical protein [Xanthobacteraceae bacterium]
MQKPCHPARLGATAVLLGLAVMAGAGAAGADCAPVLVVPSRPDIPVVVNYFDARWAVVEGECGLNRPGHMGPVVIGGRFVGPMRGSVRRAGYFPTTGQKPARGRVEVDTPPSSATAEDFSRSWSAGPARVPPADLPPPNAAPGEEGAVTNPPIVVVPQFGPRRRP